MNNMKQITYGGGHRTCIYCKQLHFGSTVHRCDEMDRALGRLTLDEEVKKQRNKRREKLIVKPANKSKDKVKSKEQKVMEHIGWFFFLVMVISWICIIIEG